jgi:hypothetical protein
MSSTSESSAIHDPDVQSWDPTARGDGPDPQRWLALMVIALAQLMVVLDASIVNIALPSAQKALHITNSDRAWVVTAYTLAFGGLLLLGGRIADFAGRKRVFIIGLIGFAAASALGGAAPNSGLLLAARALQGAFGALLAPASLALISVTFTEVKERARAFGVYGAIAGGGAAIGLVLGGVLTEYASWRWCLFVNVPIALFAAIAAVPVVRESKAGGDTKYDIPGAVTATLGLVALVYGFTKVSEEKELGHGQRGLRAVLRPGPVDAGAVRGRRAAHPAPAAPLAGHPRPQPRRLLPDLADRRARAVRDVPVPHVLLPGHAALQPAEVGTAVPAVLGRHHRRRRCHQPAAAQDRAAHPDDRRHLDRRRSACSG